MFVLINLLNHIHKDNFKVRIHPSDLKTPYQQKKLVIVFVNSMSDLFHEDVPLSLTKQMFEVISINRS